MKLDFTSHSFFESSNHETNDLEIRSHERSHLLCQFCWIVGPGAC